MNSQKIIPLFTAMDLMDSYCSMISSNEKQTPLHYAAKFGSSEVIKILIKELNVDKEKRDVFDRTPLYLAAEFGITTIILF